MVSQNKKYVLYLIIGLIISIIGGFASVWHTNKVIARRASLVSCSAFQTQQEAQRAYNEARLSGDPIQFKVYRHLDANHNGIACQNLPK